MPYPVGTGGLGTWRGRKLRQIRLTMDGGVCANCGLPATEVHHVVPVRAGGGRYDLDNLLSVCVPCHRGLTTRYPGGVAAGLARQKPACLPRPRETAKVGSPPSNRFLATAAPSLPLARPAQAAACGQPALGLALATAPKGVG